MKNSTIILKVQQRLNKLASSDYDNIHAWQIVEAFNKATVMWCRKNIEGFNLSKTGDESSKRRIDDLQILLTSYPTKLERKDGYHIAQSLPLDYFEWKRFSCKAKKDCCPELHAMMVYLTGEDNVDILLRDATRKPSFEWAETFCTLSNNKIKVYTNNEFTLQDAILTYYRQPRLIQISGISNPYTGQVSTVEVESEFKDDVVEVLIDEAVKIISGDTENINANSFADNNTQINN